MKTIYALLLVVGCCVSAAAQILTVQDSQSKSPLEAVAVIGENTQITLFTNAKGQVDISPLKEESALKFVYLGYESRSRSYTELETTGFLLDMLPVGVSLEEVVVSGHRWNQAKQEIPARITTISTKETILQNPQTAADLLGTSGEVFIQKSQQGGGSPMIRGFATNRVLICVDGVRMNTAIFRSGNLQNVISIDPFALETTEIMFGPGSVIYGSDAIGGVMNFKTLQPQFSYDRKPIVTGKAVLRYASANNEKTGHLDIGVGGKWFAAHTGFSYNDFGDLRMGGGQGPDEYLRPFYTQRQDSLDVVVTNENPLIQRPTGYSQINLLQKFAFRLAKHWQLDYGLHYSTTSNYARYDRLVRYRNGLPRSAEWYYGPQTWLLNQLTLMHHAKNVLYNQMTVRLAHQFFAESRIDRDMNDPERRHRQEKVQAWSANIDFTKSVGSRHKFFYGLEGVYNDVRSLGWNEDINTHTVVDAPARYPRSHWSSYAAYLTYQLKISDQWLFNAGARYNHVLLNARFDTTFYPFPFTQAQLQQGAPTGSVGLLFHPTNKWSVYLNAATGFRAPNVDDMGKLFDSEPGAVIIPNPNLRAEYALNGELGIAKVFGKWLKLEATGYYTYLFNALVRRDFTLNGMDSILYAGEMSKVLAIQNAARAMVFGVQAGIELQLPFGLGFRSRFNYQKGIEELDDESTSPLRHAAPWFGVSHLTYTIEKLKLDFYVVYNGAVSFENLPQEEQSKAYIYAQDKNGDPYCPAWQTFNFKVFYQFTPNFSVSGGVENIADLRYRPYSSGIVAPGRNFILSLSAQF